MKQLFIAVLLGITSLAQAQKIKVLNSITNEPIVGASLKKGDKTISISNERGEFQVKEKGEFTVTALGFKATKTTGETSPIFLEESTQTLESVVVTASRQAATRAETPVAIHKIGSALIQDTKALQLTEIINKVPGVVMLDYRNEQHGMGIRQPFGTSAYFLYMEDGLPLRPLGVFNHNALIESNLQGLNSVEVIKGPASSLYGPEAVGGAINLITKTAPGIPTAQVGLQVDEWGYNRVQFTAGAQIGKKWSIMTGGYVARQKGSWASNSDFDKSSINVRLDYQLTPKTKLWGSFAYNDYFSQTGGNIDSTGYYSRSYKSPADFTYRSSFSSRSRLTLEHKWSDNANSSLTAFYRDNALGQNPSYSISWTSPAVTGSGQVNQNSFKSFGLMGQHSQNFEFLNSKLVAGFLLDRSPNDYWAYKINLAATLCPDKKSVEKFTITQVLPSTFLGNYSAVIWNKAAYAQFDLHPVEKLRLSLGGRFDQMSFDYTNFIDNSTGTKSYEQFSPKLGVTYEASSALGFYGNFSKGFSPPALSAVFRARPAAQAAATGEKFYLSIDPAVFSNYEVGGWASLWKNKVFFDYTFYRLEGNNELLGIRQPDNTTDYQSAGKTLHEGIEYQITIRPNDSWNFRFGGTNAKHTFVDFVLSTRASDALKNVNGKEMPQAPNFIANSEVTYKYKGARIALEWQKIGPWFQDQVNKVSFEGVSVFNLRMGYNYKAYQFFTNILNLGDALYATTATRGNNATDKSTYTPAAPRTVVAGVQIDVFQLFKK
ncbi:TonB-dependent receptor domain-containing protein [Aquirufa lenticrescens]|uniref:TonB-dependent receptor domain-containing protein n=1 Tax=Aquirufa lenticrescens TaxID=2696560 RepID=UPI001CAA6752|nr:TonB-dependent receptor [Aquirufa lenticrescens]UAJ13907.1 TonB-dependent receptor [Aquirufa lenticrescens]